MRIDLHCHSKYSKRASIWLMQKLGCPESFTEPLELYELASHRGMHAVTITDHNSIDGCLEIAQLPNTFISCEYTTYFPEDRCKVHVLAHGISEAQHQDLHKARENILDFVQYACAHGIQCACAHPLYSVNDRLGREHIERLVLLFKTFELNGDVHAEMNAALYGMLRGLSPAVIEQLANRHGMLPLCKEPWLKNLIGGSDDHSSLRLGKAFTEVEGASNMEEFWSGVDSGQARVRKADSTPQSFARDIYGTMYQFCRNRFQLERYRNKDRLLRFLERMLLPRADVPDGLWMRLGERVSRMRGARRGLAANASLLELVRFEADRLIRSDGQLADLIEQGAGPHHDLDVKWFECVNQVSNAMLQHLGRQVLDCVLKARFLELFQSLGAAGSLYLMLAPYFVGFSIRSQQRKTGLALVPAVPDDAGAVKPVRLADFTDTLREVNGVAGTLRDQLSSAIALGKDYTVVTVAAERQSFERGVQCFEAVGAYNPPEYPELALPYPPFLYMLNHCYDEGYTHLHASTPGPVGLAALAIARILHLPISATYHTALPQYAKIFTEDAHVEDLLWKFMVWFYDQMDYVYAPSKATAAELVARGVNAERVRVAPRGVDTKRFHPSRRVRGALARHGVPEHHRAAVYLGRVSREKGLSVLVQAMRNLDARDQVTLVVVGDGPYGPEMKVEAQGLPVVFTGYVEGDALADVLASGDFLVFPSATDTFGNVVLEAFASGIPAVVTDKGGPAEVVCHGETGLIVPAGDPAALGEAIRRLAGDDGLRERMGAAARADVEKRGTLQQFEALWDMYSEDVPGAPSSGGSSVSFEGLVAGAISAAAV